MFIGKSSMKMKQKIIYLAVILGVFLVSAAVASASYDYTTNWFYNGNPVNGVRAVNFVCADNGCYTLGARLSDKTSSTNSITTSYPIPSPAYGYATYWFAPGFIYQEISWMPTGHGSYARNINFTKYPNCQAVINSINFAPSVNEGENLAITANVLSALHEADAAPFGEPNDTDIANDYLSVLTSVTLTIRDSMNNAIYTETKHAYIMEDSTSNVTFNWTPDFTQAGSYSVAIITNVPDSKCGSAAPMTTSKELTVNDVYFDTIAPIYINMSANPANAIYAPGQRYEFNVTWLSYWINGSGFVNYDIEDSLIEINGVAYTPTAHNICDYEISPGVFYLTDTYSFVINDLAAGNYSYRWLAKDISGNVNQTALTNYEIGKAAPAGLWIEMLPGDSVVYPTGTTVRGAGCPAQLNCTLERNGAAVSNPDMTTLAIGTYDYVYRTLGNVNYTSASVARTLGVREETSEDKEKDENATIIIDSNELADGHTFYLNEGQKAKFIFCGSPYYLKLSEIDDKKAEFTINSGKITFILKAKDSKEVGLEDESDKDVLVKVESISSNRVKVYIKKISDASCTIQAIAEGAGELIGYTGIGTTTPSAKISTNRVYLLVALGIGVVLLITATILLSFKGKKTKGIEINSRA